MATKNEVLIRIKANSREAERALKGFESKFKSFGKTISDAKFKILGSFAAIAGAGFTLKKAFDFLALGANIEKQRNAFDNLAESVGASGDEILFRLKQVSRGTVDLMSLIQSSSRALVLGIAPDKLTKLMEISRAASKATGDSIQKSFNDIVIGMARQSRLILDNLGIIVNVGDANKKYAEELGKSASALTDVEKKQAFMNATLKAGQKIIDGVGEDMLSAADKVDIIKTAFVEAKDAAASFFKNLVFQGIPGESTIKSLLIQIEDLKNSFNLGDSAQAHKDKVNKAIEEIEKKVSGLLLKMQGKREADTIFKRAQSQAEELNQTLKGFDIVPGQEEVGRANNLLQIFDKIESRNVAIAESIQASVKEEETRIQQLKEKLEGVNINQLFTLTSESVDTGAIERQIQEAEGRLSGLSDRAKISGPFLDFEKQKELFKKIEPEILATFHKLDTESQKTFLQIQKRFGETINFFKDAGVETDEEFKKIAENAIETFKRIEESGQVTGPRLKEVWEEYRATIEPGLDLLGVKWQEYFKDIERRFPDLVVKVKKEMTEMEKITKQVSADMKDSLADFIETGEIGFDSMVSSWRRKLAEFAADKIWDTIANLIKRVGQGGAGTPGSSSFVGPPAPGGGGGGGGSSTLSTLATIASIAVMFLHKGGQVKGAPVKYTPAIRIPSFDRGGEVLAQLRTDEFVVSPKGTRTAGVNALNRINRGDLSDFSRGRGVNLITNINIGIQSIDTQTGADFLMRPESAEAIVKNFERAIVENDNIRAALEQGRM